MMKNSFLSLIFASSILFSLPSKSMEPSQILKSFLTFAGMNSALLPANKKLDNKTAQFKTKQDDAEKTLKTLETIASIKTPQMQEQLLAQLPEKEQKTLKRLGSTPAACRSRINYYQSRKDAYESAQSLIKEEKAINSQVGFFTSLTMAIFHGYCAFKS